MPQPQSRNEPLSAAVIGEGVLAVQCTQLLLERGVQVRVIMPGEPAFERWAQQQGLRIVGALPQLAEELQAAPPDVLFSIVNQRILPPEVLRAPQVASINYHDSPLPKYAGVHATSWALLHRERMHAISWHLMTGEVDAGHLLKQCQVEIAPNDDAYSLNVKCFKAALQGFRELISDLLAGQLHPQPQDLSQRSYFGRQLRPAADAILSWTRGSEQLDAVVRALQFRRAPNPLARPKLWLGDRAYVVTDWKKEDTCSGARPGTVLSVEDGLFVATATTDVRIRALSTLEGAPVGWPEIHTHAPVGVQLPTPSPEWLASVSALDAKVSIHERYWARELAAWCPGALPEFVLRAGGRRPERPSWSPIEDSGSALARLRKRFSQASTEELLLATWSGWLGRSTGQRKVDTVFADGALTLLVGELDALYAAAVPLRISLDDASAEALLSAARDALLQARQRHTFARDIYMRLPELARVAGEYPSAAGILLRPWKGAEDSGTPALLTLAINEPGDGVGLVSALGADGTSAAAESFVSFMREFVG